MHPSTRPLILVLARMAGCTALASLTACGGSPPEVDVPVQHTSAARAAPAPARASPGAAPETAMRGATVGERGATGSTPAAAPVAVVEPAARDCALEADSLVPPPQDTAAMDDPSQVPADEPVELPAPTPQT